jgi:hypothetical protein
MTVRRHGDEHDQMHATVGGSTRKTAHDTAGGDSTNKARWDVIYDTELASHATS